MVTPYYSVHMSKVVGRQYFGIGPSVLRAPAEQTKVATVLGIGPSGAVQTVSDSRRPLF